MGYMFSQGFHHIGRDNNSNNKCNLRIEENKLKCSASRIEFNRIIFFDGCKTYRTHTSPRPLNHCTQIDRNCVDCFSIWRYAFFFSFGRSFSVLFWLKPFPVMCVWWNKNGFSILENECCCLVDGIHTLINTTKCCKYSHPSRIIKSFGYSFLFFHLHFRTLFVLFKMPENIALVPLLIHTLFLV